ncbi:MAG: T9SS type A sorting domain-containing protein, partial [bacterium]
FELAADSLLTNPVIDSTLTAADTTKIARKLLNNQTYWWRVRAGNAAGGGPFSAQRKFRIVITSVQAREEGPSEFRLSQNYPNPFNPVTGVQFSVVSNQWVSLKVYDVLGNEVATLVNEKKPAGFYRVSFDAKGLVSGVYFYRLQAGNFAATRKLLLVR